MERCFENANDDDDDNCTVASFLSRKSDKKTMALNRCALEILNLRNGAHGMHYNVLVREFRAILALHSSEPLRVVAPRGFHSLIDAFHKRILELNSENRVFLSHQVIKVVSSNEKVQITVSIDNESIKKTFESGKIDIDFQLQKSLNSMYYWIDKVLLACSGLQKISFSPKLSSKQQNALQTLKTHSAAKFILRFKHRFWHPLVGGVAWIEGNVNQIYYPQPRTNNNNENNNNNNTNDCGALMFYVRGKCVAEYWRRLSADEIGAECLRELCRVYESNVVLQSFCDIAVVFWDEPFVDAYSLSGSTE
jgi:hypothetical protein